MRIVVCDADPFMREMVESLVRTTGHEVVGIADTTAASVGLIQAGRPEAVVLDLSLGYNTDFDIIDAAISVGARPIVFTHNADAEILGSYPVAPTVVVKPDLDALGQVLVRLEREAPDAAVSEHDRRARPARAVEGPDPTGLGDAQAFFVAINAAEPGDALLGLEVGPDAEAVAEEVRRHLRQHDRLLLMLPHALRIFLPGAGEEGVRSVLGRIGAVRAGEGAGHATFVVVRDGEHGADAFDRLKRAGRSAPA